MRRPTITATVLVLATALGLSACGGGDDTPALQPLPQQWSKAAVARVESLATRSGRSGTECTPLKFVDPPALDPARAKYDWLIAPTAVADCDRGEETVEFATFRSTADRDRFLDERTNTLCERAAAIGATVPPFAWVTGDGGGAWSAQADSRATARALARAMDGSTDVRPCDPKDTLGWTKQGVARVRELGGKMANTGLPCAGFALVPKRDVTQGVAKAPAAVASCSISVEPPSTGATGTTGATGAAPSPTTTLYAAVFDGQGQTRDDFVSAVLSGTGACAVRATAVLGKDFAIVLPEAYAALVAGGVGGRVGPSCR
jgi:hypothetical protein